MRAAAKQEKDENLRETLIYSLGLFRDPALIQTALSIVLTDEFDRRESISILIGVSREAKTRDLAYDFVKQNWDALVAKLPTDSGAYFPYVAGGFCDAGHRQDVATFFQDRSTRYSGGPRILTQVLEGIDLCAAYRKAQEPSATAFLEHYGSAN
jgi:alanyl aminopeptidase